MDVIIIILLHGVKGRFQKETTITSGVLFSFSIII